VEINNYESIDVSLLQATPKPLEMVNIAANITMKKDFDKKNLKGINSKIKFLLDANHTSPFEHIVYSFLVKGASRSFLAQMTRHRMASYTSGSQHYQNYSDYGFRIESPHTDNELIDKTLDTIMNTYNTLIEEGVPKYEARQILPNGMENNLMITMNARSLINFYNLRLCNRNTAEIHTVAHKMHGLTMEHFPELFKYIGPDCYQNGGCKQGKMTCGTIWKPDVKNN